MEQIFWEPYHGSSQGCPNTYFYAKILKIITKLSVLPLLYHSLLYISLKYSLFINCVRLHCEDSADYPNIKELCRYISADIRYTHGQRIARFCQLLMYIYQFTLDIKFQVTEAIYLHTVTFLQYPHKECKP